MQYNELGKDPDLTTITRLKTVSHTLKTTLAEHLRNFAFESRLSESCIIEYALQQFFQSGSSEDLALQLQAAGCGRRRKMS